MNTKLIIASLLILSTATACQRETAAQPAHVTPPPNEVWITKNQIDQTGIATTEARFAQARLADAEGSLARAHGQCEQLNAAVSQVQTDNARLCAELGEKNL